jgi:peptidoglycan/LPS O-acetylase OafA/YrhL
MLRCRESTQYPDGKVNHKQVFGTSYQHRGKVAVLVNPNTPLLRKHMPELDVLRGLAILMVLLFHGLYWSAATTSFRIVNLFIKATVVGWLGVNLFFVLSGFLITGILLDTKGRPTYYRQFYLRRVLRILPAYLAVLVVLDLIRYLLFPQTVAALLFVANYMTILHIAGGYGPLWSLSVEEQFYVLWPGIVSKVSVRTLTLLSLGLCILEPFLRWLDASGHLPLGDPRTATYLIADNLALGALAAIFARSRYGTLRNGIRLGSALCIAGLFIFLAGYPFGILHRASVIGATLQTVPWNIFFTGLLLLSLGLRSPFASGVWTKPLRFLGFISYGLYLIHVLAFHVYDTYVVPRISNPSLHQFLQLSLVRFALSAGFSILIAWLSRRFYEETFLRLGKNVQASAPVSERV